MYQHNSGKYFLRWVSLLYTDEGLYYISHASVIYSWISGRWLFYIKSPCAEYVLPFSKHPATAVKSTKKWWYRPCLGWDFWHLPKDFQAETPGLRNRKFALVFYTKILPMKNGDECQGRKDINVNPKGQIKTISLTRPKGPPKDNFLERIWDPLFEKQTIAWWNMKFHLSRILFLFFLVASPLSKIPPPFFR